jgi:hypothetical protein
VSAAGAVVVNQILAGSAKSHPRGSLSYKAVYLLIDCRTNGSDVRKRMRAHSRGTEESVDSATPNNIRPNQSAFVSIGFLCGIRKNGWDPTFTVAADDRDARGYRFSVQMGFDRLQHDYT